MWTFPSCYNCKPSKDVSTSITYEKFGELYSIEFSLAPANDYSTCSTQFDDGQPLDLKVIPKNGMVTLSWKLPKTGIKQHRSKPYEFKLFIDDKVYRVGIAFDPPNGAPFAFLLPIHL